MTLTVKFAGVGGQGIQLAGKLLGLASFKEGHNISQGTVYEPATSGGLTVADITIAGRDREILYPFIETPDVLVCFAQRAWDEYKQNVSEETIVIADRDNVHNLEGSEKAQLVFHLPFSSKARELGSEKVTNVMVIGFISEMLDFDDHHIQKLSGSMSIEDAEEYELLEVSPENFEDSLISSSPKRFQELNLKAFRMGYNMSLAEDYQKVKI